MPETLPKLLEIAVRAEARRAVPSRGRIATHVLAARFLRHGMVLLSFCRFRYKFRQFCLYRPAEDPTSFTSSFTLEAEEFRRVECVDGRYRQTILWLQAEVRRSKRHSAGVSRYGGHILGLLAGHRGVGVDMIERSQSVALTLASLILFAPAFDHGMTAQSPSHGDARLCLSEVLTTELPTGFVPMGLTATEDLGSDPAVTLWSRSSVLVIGMSPGEGTVRHIAQADLPTAEPVAVALAAWRDQMPIVELFDVQGGAVWTLDIGTMTATRGAASTSAASASGAIRQPSGWVRAYRRGQPGDSLSRITIVPPGARPAVENSNDHTTVSRKPRSIDETLHVRPGPDGGFLVKEAAFPFATVAFTREGDLKWHSYPVPRELRETLGESDLRYVFATPAVNLDGAVLNTYVALRSGRRVSAVKSSDQMAARYRLIPSEHSFLAVLPEHRLLVGTRRSVPYMLSLFEWRRISQRQRCT